MDSPYPLLDDDECKALILALFVCHPEGRTEAQVQRWLDWCHQKRVEAGLVQLVIDGDLVPVWADGEAEPKFTQKEG